MKMKLLLSLAVIGTFALSAAFAQTAAPKLQMTGKVDAITADVITVRKPNDGKWVWDIKIGPGTDTTVTGKTEVGATVTVTYIELNAQKKESQQ
jgi:hypothetical protein